MTILKTWISERDDKEFRSFFPVTEQFCQLVIDSVFTQLSYLNLVMWKLDLSINIESMSQYNFSNYDVKWLIKQILRPDDILS